MIEQQQQDWLRSTDQFAGWDQLSEGELINRLQQVEQARATGKDKESAKEAAKQASKETAKGADEATVNDHFINIERNARLDHIEAIILTELAGRRFGKTDDDRLLLEWLEKAFLLDPAHHPAPKLLVKLYLSKLQKHLFVNHFPVIRETDNAVARRTQVQELLQIVAREQGETGSWRHLLEKAQNAAEVLEDGDSLTRIDSITRIYEERDMLLHKLQEIAQAYAESLRGLFYSDELLSELKQTIRQLTEQQAMKLALLSDMENEAIHSTEQKSSMEQLDELIGMTEIKQRVKQLSQFLRYQQLRSEKGWILQDGLPLHLVLMGNPGTGKTTLARLIAKLYHQLGLLERSDVIEVDRSQLVGAYIGQTEQRTMEAIKRAAGGVLFIDEAYSLKRVDASGSDYGQVAIDTLVAAMTNGELAGKFVVILAGYPEEMRNFLQANPGLRSRFPEAGHFTLADYTNDELLKIAERVAARNDFSLTEQAKKALIQRIERERVDDTFGNARTVTNIVLDAIFAKGRNISDDTPVHLADFTLLFPEDMKENDDRDEPFPARESLESLIGLSGIKEEMKKIEAFLQVQRKRVEKGLAAVPIELHAVFTGNPGTGKTTVAKLYADMLRENGYLKRGHLVTVSRADLVAGYVGQTAAQTKRKIREALGGVLFIDEAYSLFAGSDNDFGREAINTLVDEMTKHQENLVVVLAGYPVEMERFIASNPGLASRFKKFFLFPDYSVPELIKIIKQTVKERDYAWDEELNRHLKEQLTALMQQGLLHGNARFAKTLVQEAIQNQAVRLSTQSVDVESLDQEELATLTWEDFISLFPAGE